MLFVLIIQDGQDFERKFYIHINIAIFCSLILLTNIFNGISALSRQGIWVVQTITVIVTSSHISLIILAVWHATLSCKKINWEFVDDFLFCSDMLHRDVIFLYGYIHINEGLAQCPNACRKITFITFKSTSQYFSDLYTHLQWSIFHVLAAIRAN